MCLGTGARQLTALIFATENEWVTWTPEGYYATSPGGERLMGWLVGHGPDKMASVYPASQFRKSLYRPDVIKLILRTGSTERAVELAEQELKRHGAATTIDRLLLPQVIITSPGQPKLRVSQSTLWVQAVATPADKTPIMALQLLLDGRPYQGSSTARFALVKPAEGQPWQRSWNVELSPGTHQIVVKAETSLCYGNLSDPLEVAFCLSRSSRPRFTYWPWESPSMMWNLSGWRLPRRMHNRSPKCSSKPPGPCSPGTVQSPDRCPGQPPWDSGGTGLAQGASHPARRERAVLRRARPQDNNGVFYLLPADAHPDNILATGVSEDVLKRYCQSIPGRLVVMLDACHTGALGGRRRALDGLTDNMVRDLVNEDYGVIVMCLSMGREYSLENAQWGHGAFTKALTEGLQGKADFTHRQVGISTIWTCT